METGRSEEGEKNYFLLLSHYEFLVEKEQEDERIKRNIKQTLLRNAECKKPSVV